MKSCASRSPRHHASAAGERLLERGVPAEHRVEHAEQDAREDEGEDGAQHDGEPGDDAIVPAGARLDAFNLRLREAAGPPFRLGAIF